MVLQYWGIDRDWDALARELDYSLDEGTEFDRLALLSGVVSLPVRSVEDLDAFLARAIPVIANLLVSGPGVLGYDKRVPFLHAVVVLAVDAETVAFSDPMRLVEQGTSDHRVCSKQEFVTAWRGGWAIRVRGVGR
jgi:hypothetical protein